MRPRQDQDPDRQSESSATPYVTELPPPGYPMRDVLRMTGQLPTEANKPNATLSTSLTQGKATPVELSSSQTPSPLNCLFSKIYHFFDNGTQIASSRFAAIQTSVTMGEAEVKHSAYQTASRALVGKSLPWNSCKLAATPGAPACGA